MKILINSLNNNVIGINQEKTFLSYTVNFPDINIEKNIKSIVKYQKNNDDGSPLYFNEINNQETTDYFTEYNNSIIYFEPVLFEKELIEKTTLLESPSSFTLNEILDAKAQYLLKNSEFKDINLFEELKEDHLSLNLSTNSAHTGLKFIKLFPNGQCRTNKINLPRKITKIKLYLESQPYISTEIGSNTNSFIKVENDIVEFNEPVDQIYIRFKNESKDDYQEIYSYGILF